MNQYKSLSIKRAKELENSDLSRHALCLKLAQAERKAGAMAAMIAESTFNEVPDRFKPLLTTIQAIRRQQTGGV
jgi:hypothetical protein